jgi:hypothetical protein
VPAANPDQVVVDASPVAPGEQIAPRAEASEGLSKRLTLPQAAGRSSGVC